MPDLLRRREAQHRRRASDLGSQASTVAARRVRLRDIRAGAAILYTGTCCETRGYWPFRRLSA